MFTKKARSDIQIRYRTEWIVFTIIMSILCVALSLHPIFSSINPATYNVALKVVNKITESEPDPDVVIISIDDKSLGELGSWPWRRYTHGLLLKQLSEAKAIGFDLLFGDTNANYYQDDLFFADAIKKNGRVVLANVINGPDYSFETDPIAVLANSTASKGFINIEIDADGVVRRVFLQHHLEDDRTAQHLAVHMLKIGGEKQYLSHSLDYENSGFAAQRIPFLGPLGTFMTVSYTDVLNRRIPKSFFKNKYVLIGSGSTGLWDSYPTPTTIENQNMSGVEIIATILQAARHGTWITDASKVNVVILNLFPVILLCIGLRTLSPRRAISFSFLMLLLVLFGMVLFLLLLRIWIPPSSALQTILLCYPIWAWRTQEIALQQIDQEIRNLRNEAHLFSVTLTDDELKPSNASRESSLNDQVVSLRYTMSLVKNLRQFVAEGFNGMPYATALFDYRGRLSSVTDMTRTYMKKLNAPTPHNGQELNEFLDPIIIDEEIKKSLVEEIALSFFLEPSSDSKVINAWHDGLEFKDKINNDMLLKCVNLTTTSGQHVGFIITLIDISAIRQAERSRDETMRFISHDMRSPQSSILALIELQKDNSTALPVTDLLDRIQHLSNRTLSLVESFVQLTRAESKVLTFVPIDLSDLLTQVTAEFWGTSKKRNIHIQLELPKDIAFIQGDTTLLFRVFSNLIDNAMKYSPNDTIITCSLISHFDNWLVLIKDQGIGIEEQDLASLFDPFTRVSKKERKDMPTGVGLGLAFVKTVIIRHYGNIEVSSQYGNGTTFEITLPKDTSEDVV